MARAKKLYAERNSGKMRRYRILNNASKHWREEDIDGSIVKVCYSGPGSSVHGAVSEIWLTPADAEKYAHMHLEEIDPLPPPPPPPPPLLPPPPPPPAPRPRPTGPPVIQVVLPPARVQDPPPAAPWVPPQVRSDMQRVKAEEGAEEPEEERGLMILIAMSFTAAIAFLLLAYLSYSMPVLSASSMLASVFFMYFVYSIVQHRSSRSIDRVILVVGMATCFVFLAFSYFAFSLDDGTLSKVYAIVCFVAGFAFLAAASSRLVWRKRP